jgi:hypothetical protein
MRYIALLILFVPLMAFSQTIPAWNNYANESARVRQLLGDTNIIESFSIRPVSTGTDSALLHLAVGKNVLSHNSSAGLYVLPLRLLGEYNVNRPYGYNNGSLYPNRGVQSLFSAGLLFKAGILRIQLQPELVYAQNRLFTTFAGVQGNNNDPQLMTAYFNTINGIDAPERFGNNPITHLYPGQSKVTLVFHHVEAGVSTENLWWGPGVQNSIMMSNSAPGFLHWAFNSSTPVKTRIGAFEWQLIGGELKQSGYPPTDVSKLIYAQGMLVPKPKVNRYISAFTINWQPKWIKGLYLGVTGYDYLDRDSSYHQRGMFSKLFPVFAGSSAKVNSVADSSRGDNQDFAFAFNIRQVFPEAHTEVYFEWARNDHAASFNDFEQEPEHASAYTVGARRLFGLNNKRYLQLKFELTHLQNPPTYLVRQEPSWYIHLTSPRDRYTNNGRYVGAGVGPGGNSMMWDVSLLNGENSYGVTFERLVHNNDLYYEAFSGTGMFYRHWVDVASTFYANLKFDHYILSAELTQYIP